ncbi:MAG: chemotaxis protein CheB [Reinekea sp.]
MNGHHNRVGIIGSTPLVQHQMQLAVQNAGYEVAVNTSPDRLNKKFLSNETIRLWVVELGDVDDQWADLIQEILELTDAPVLFGDGNIPGQGDEEFPRWNRRIREKLESFAPPVEAAMTAPEINLESLVSKPQQPVYALPEALRLAPSPDLGPIWVLCASLGGPQAVKEFLDLLPGDIPATFLYAQHIDAGCLGALVHSIGRHTHLSVVDGEHGLQMANGKVYVVPVNNEIKFTDNHGILWQNAPWSGPYGPSHDHLLKNVSEHYADRCHTIIFSGMGSDGALGASLVKEQGGTVWAQTTDSCVQSSMPDSADETGVVDWRGTPAEMAEKLIRWLAEHSVQAA